MDAAKVDLITSIALTTAQQLLKAAQAAQTGDLAEAERLLRGARQHFGESVDRWNTTKAPS